MDDDEKTTPPEGSAKGTAPPQGTTGGRMDGARAAAGQVWKAARDVAQEARVVGSRLLGRLSVAAGGFGRTASPTVREVGAKAAEVAAVAGERAGPLAHKVADATEDAGRKLAARASGVAADLRRSPVEGSAGSAQAPGMTTGTVAAVEEPPAVSGTAGGTAEAAAADEAIGEANEEGPAGA